MQSSDYKNMLSPRLPFTFTVNVLFFVYLFVLFVFSDLGPVFRKPINANS